MRQKNTLVNLLESYHLLQGIRFLYENNLFAELKAEKNIETLADSFQFDCEKFKALFHYINERTDILECEKEPCYRISEKYREYKKFDFWIEQYLGAYGFDHSAIDEIIRHSSDPKRFIDYQRHSQAYEGLNGSGFPFLKSMILEMGVNNLLEFGCGTGALLIELAEANPDFIGIGVDVNQAMCAGFSKRIHEAGLENRLFVLNADANNIAGKLNSDISDQLELIVAASLMNELFDKKTSENKAVRWLKLLKDVFPGRRLLVADYYSRLGTDRENTSEEVLLHDWIQIISGQGIPPSSKEGWTEIYQESGCTLLDAVEPPNSRIPCFVHLLAL